MVGGCFDCAAESSTDVHQHLPGGTYRAGDVGAVLPRSARSARIATRKLAENVLKKWLLTSPTPAELPDQRRTCR
jgi:hypothetical protein